jgi:hypothetical protein
LGKWQEEPHQVAHFLIRLLFCLFAEDVGLLPNQVFSRLIERTRNRPALVTQQLALRARILLAAADGANNSQIARQVEVSLDMVRRWPERWLAL